MSQRALRLRLCNRRGLHARAAAKFVNLARSFDAEILVRYDGHTVPAGSIMGLLMLAAGFGKDIELAASGKDAARALQALGALVEGGFGES